MTVWGLSCCRSESSCLAFPFALRSWQLIVCNTVFMPCLTAWNTANICFFSLTEAFLFYKRYCLDNFSYLYTPNDLVS